MTAEERGMQMATQVPMKDLPPLALEFMRKLGREVGMCGEVMITAYTVYAQCVEKLECTDSLYQARPQDVAWFEEKTKVTAEPKVINDPT